ncbi:hypothetical protein AB0L22_09390 [Micromonospora haikouensis]|uniref:hypothetical protein n=1 Tax=Micromonospora haikouensis TaxID=686309 RepID=UPI003429E5B8
MTARYARRLPACAHVEIGTNLQNTREYLIHLASELSHVYPKTSPQVRAANQALRAVDQLRNALDNASADELPGDGWAPTIYYGANDDVRQVDLARVMEVHWAGNPSCCRPG